MRLISCNALKEGMIIGKTIWNEAGHPLLQKDAKVNARIIQRLKQLNIQYVYIDDRLSKNIEVEETVSPAVRHETIQHIRHSFEEVKNIGTKAGSYILDQQSKAIGSLIDDLLKTILESEEVVTILTDVYLNDEYLYQHSFQVTLYSLAIAKEMGYSHEDLRTIGMGAMLHDIGKVLVPSDILLKDAPLTEEEYTEIKQHTRYGFDILRNLHSISLLIAHCAFQHHERLDGSGYPRGLLAPEIHPFAKIIAVADVFDAVTTNRVYRSKMHPAQGIHLIEADSGIKFDRDVVEALKRSVVHYPNGTVVVLSAGLRGVVCRQEKLQPARPWVRIFEKDNVVLNATYEISLAQYDNIEIIQIDANYVLKENNGMNL